MFPGELERMEDDTLVSGAFRGEYLAFEVLYYRHRDWVVLAAWFITGDRGDALEVLQETFLELLHHFPEPGSFRSFRALLYPTIEHQCALLSRRRRKIVHIEDARLKRARGRAEKARSELDSDPLEPSHKPGDCPHCPERMLEALPEDKRKVARLHFALGMRFEETADALNLPPKTVITRLQEALEDLEEGPFATDTGREHPPMIELEAFRCDDLESVTGATFVSGRYRTIRRHIEACETCRTRIVFLNSLRDNAFRPSSPIVVPAGMERAIIGEGRTRAEAVRRGLEPPTRREHGPRLPVASVGADSDPRQRIDGKPGAAGNLVSDWQHESKAELARQGIPSRLRWILWFLLVGLAMILVVRETCLWQDEPEAKRRTSGSPTFLEARSDVHTPSCARTTRNCRS